MNRKQASKLITKYTKLLCEYHAEIDYQENLRGRTINSLSGVIDIDSSEMKRIYKEVRKARKLLLDAMVPPTPRPKSKYISPIYLGHGTW